MCVCVCVCVCTCVTVFWAGQNVRDVMEGGHEAAGEEEDIIGDFPLGLRYLKHTHLVFLKFLHKAGLVCPETAQEARSDMGKRV